MEKRIEAYTLVDFIQLIQTHVEDGWLIDFEDNTHIPTGVAGYYYCRVGKGAKIAAILKPKPSELVQSGCETDEQLKIATEAAPFVPSISFSMQATEQDVPIKKPIGRPKSEQI